jgi:hypothetical protein
MGWTYRVIGGVLWRQNEVGGDLDGRDVPGTEDASEMREERPVSLLRRFPRALSP